MIAPFSESDLLLQLKEEVEKVEAELRHQVGSPIALVDAVGRQTLEAGGKRLRPAFVSLSARAISDQYDSARARRLGACMEMIHMATLIHDDVIDHADMRRGKPTASSIHGNTASILSGDVLLARAMVLLAQDGDLAIIRMVSEAVVEIAEGEVRELEMRGNFDLSEEEHRRILRMKTASFIQCCCETGALIAGATAAQRRALGEFGHHIGMAFQIVDDLLDYRSDKTGKPKAGDYREGQATLPLIHLRRTLSDEELERASRHFGNGVSDDELRQISLWMEERGSFASAESAARAEVDRANLAVDRLPAGEARNMLRQIGEFVLSRQS